MKRVTSAFILGMLLSCAVLSLGLGCSQNSSTGSTATGATPYVGQSLYPDVEYFDLGYPYVSWQDGFETYTVGDFPSNWIADGNAPDDNNCVVDDVFFEGRQSLRLYGQVGGCWAGIAYRKLLVTPPFEVKLAIYNGDEPLSSSCQPARGLVGIIAGPDWSLPERYFLYFNRNGVIYTGGELGDLGPYESKTWYTIRVRYERPAEDKVRLWFWLDNKFVGTSLYDAHDQEDSYTYLELVALEGSAWFDVVEIRDRKGTQPLLP